MSGPGYNEVFRATAAHSGSRVTLDRWDAEPVSLVTLQSDYDREVIVFPIAELDTMIALLQQAKAALAGLTDSAAAASSPAAVAPVTHQT